MKHTPGPWRIEENMEGGTTPDILGPTMDDLVCRMYGGQYQTVDANALLISKAPEMYELLKRVLNLATVWELRDINLENEALLREIDKED